MWVLIAGVILTYQLIASRATTRAYRVAAGLGLATGLVLVWINGAVGLIGSEDNPANLLYAGVLAIGAVGAALARLEPSGMARALFATALTQFLVRHRPRPVASRLLPRRGARVHVEHSLRAVVCRLGAAVPSSSTPGRSDGPACQGLTRSPISERAAPFHLELEPAAAITRPRPCPRFHAR